MERLPPSPSRQFLFIIAFGIGIAFLVYLGSLVYPREAVMVWHLEAWTYVVAGVFWFVDRTIRNLFAKRAKTKAL
ncbi:MAG TPA: hypothetical protein VFO61_02745 [Alphaproteobacteria bacterium]|nr:hypothetical protein [Alphaproteobacteria bacterium]